MLGALLTVAVDTQVHFGQFTVVYPLLFLVLAPQVPKRLLWRTATMLILLIYVGFLMKLIVYPASFPPGAINYRLLNRSIVAAILLALVPIVSPWLPDDDERPSPDRLWDSGVGYDARVRSGVDSGDEVDRLMMFTRPFLAGLFAVLFSVGVAIVDLVTPSQFNLAIFYALPLIVISWTRSPVLIWASTAVFLLALLVAYVYGPVSPEESDTFTAYLAHSRWLTALVLVIFAGVLHLWVRRPSKHF